MLIRPADASGDVLPVLSYRDLLSGPETVAQLVQYRLSLLRGEWWKTPEEGFFILERMREEISSSGETYADLPIKGTKISLIFTLTKRGKMGNSDHKSKGEKLILR